MWGIGDHEGGVKEEITTALTVSGNVDNNIHSLRILRFAGGGFRHY